MAKKSLVKPESGYGVVGVNVFFSIADIYRLRDTIDAINKGGADGEEAMKGLANLHNKLADAINSAEDSLFNPQTDEEDEI